MSVADKCRVCLCDDRHMYAISNTVFQKIWEKLTNAKFDSHDGKPLLACYMCCAYLRTSHKLIKRALKAEELLTAAMNNDSERSQKVLLLKDTATHDLDYKYVIEEQYKFESVHFEINTMEKIKKENEGGTEEDHGEENKINIKEEQKEMRVADKCRVCLCADRRMHSIINTVFQKIWEKLTNAKFNTNDGKPLLVCYICCAHLRKSHKLMKRALNAEELLTAVINNGTELSKKTVLLIASLSHYFDYKRVIEEKLECKQFVRNTVDDIKSEIDGETEDDEVYEIYIKEELEDYSDTNQEQNIDVADDVESGVSPKDDTPPKMILEKIDICTSARKRKLNESKRIKLEDTTKDGKLLDNTLLKYLPNNNLKATDISLSKSLTANCYQINKNSTKVYIPPKHRNQATNVIVGNNMTLASDLCYNNSDNKMFNKKRADVFAPNTSSDRSDKGHKSKICNRKELEYGFLSYTDQYKCVTKRELNVHPHKYTEEILYTCDSCDYTCLQKKSLQRHIKYKHTKEKNFSCDICNYTFVTQSGLNVHRRKHTGEKQISNATKTEEQRKRKAKNQRDYYQRKKVKINKKIPKSNAQRSKEFRERQKNKQTASDFDNLKRRPSRAEYMKEYRQKVKLKNRIVQLNTLQTPDTTKE